MAASEIRFAQEMNEKERIELLENATPGSIEKATKYGMKIVQGKLYFDNLSIRVNQSKTKNDHGSKFSSLSNWKEVA